MGPTTITPKREKRGGSHVRGDVRRDGAVCVLKVRERAVHGAQVHQVELLRVVPPAISGDELLDYNDVHMNNRDEAHHAPQLEVRSLAPHDDVLAVHGATPSFRANRTLGAVSQRPSEPLLNDAEGHVRILQGVQRPLWNG